MGKEVELVIKISEESYNRVLKSGVIYGSDTAHIGGAIIDSIELPENHGDLKDTQNINKEMLEVLKCLKYQFDDRIAESEYSKDKDLLEALESNKMASKALDMAIKMSIKALEQQPSVDAVSRQSVLDTLDKMDKALDTDRTVENYKKLLTECYKDLTPVIPKEKTAYWLPYAERDGKTVEWICSSCRRVKSATSDRTEYCPICGAKMIE